MNRLLFPVISLCFVLFSCNGVNNDSQFSAIIESLENSNKSITNVNRGIHDELEQKRRDPQIYRRAEIWPPKALKVNTLSVEMLKYTGEVMNRLKKSERKDAEAVVTLFEKQGETAQLFRKTTDFKQALIAVIKPGEFDDNPLMKKELERIKEEFKLSFSVDSAKYASYFKNTSYLGAVAMVAKIQNDILMTENREITFFNYSTTPIYHGYERFSPLVFQNSSYLKAGQTVEIKAGVGAFSQASQPVITINGMKIPVDFDAVANYKMKVPDKPGKYSIPVKIEFSKPDGTTVVAEKNVEYTIAQ